MDPYMISLSSGQNEELLPVQFADKKEEADYLNMLFPPRKPLVGYSTNRKTFARMYEGVAQAAEVAGAMQHLARYIYLQLPLVIEANADHQYRETVVAIRLQDEVSACVAARDKHSSNRLDPMRSCAQGSQHIIRPSERYPGGMDVLFSGSPGGAAGRSTTSRLQSIMTSATIKVLSDDVAISDNYGTTLEAAVLIARAVRSWMLGKNAPTYVPGQRVVHQVRFTNGMWDSKAILAEVTGIIQSTLGLKVDLSALEVDADDLNLESTVSKFFSAIVIDEPCHELLGMMRHAPNRDPASLPLSATAMWMASEMTTSIALNLPKEVVAFATQTPENEKFSLSALNTWAASWAASALRTPGRSAKGGSLPLGRAPRYVQTPTRSARLPARRKELGLATDPGRTNEDHLTVGPEGRLIYCPPADALMLSNAEAYEEAQEDILDHAFSAGVPVAHASAQGNSTYLAVVSPNFQNEHRAKKDMLNQFAGSLQTGNWDYNCVLVASQSKPSALNSISLVGSSIPDNLSISEYLTMPAGESLRIAYAYKSNGNQAAPEKGDLNTVSSLLEQTFITQVVAAYAYLASRGKAPDALTLVADARKALHLNGPIENPSTEDRIAFLNKGIYDQPSMRIRLADGENLMGVSKIPEGDFVTAFENGQAIVHLLKCALEDARGTPRSNLAAYARETGEIPENVQGYFELEVSQLAEMRHLFEAYIGGRAFYEMLTYIRKAPLEDLAMVDTKSKQAPIPFEVLMTTVKPFATYMTKYIPEAAERIADAEVMSEGLQKDDGVTVDDIHMPGSKEGFQLFPHQAEALKTLAQPKPPRFAALDIAPGGGKTILGLVDIGGLIHRGLIKRPCVMCPNGLVRNWMEDLHAVCEGRWNVIPLTTDVMNRWGEERLLEYIKKAPINTIFVVGLSFLNTRGYQVVIGNHVEKVTNSMELCKQFGFDYVILDESHKAKNPKSLTHRAIKQLTVASYVKYVRIATGTLVQTSLSDVSGQSALFGAHIFRTRDEFEGENSSAVQGTLTARSFGSEVPYLARKQLAKHCAVMTFKKKEWAFLLPRPIESFLPVKLDFDETDELGKAHQMMYDALLLSTVDAIRADSNVLGMLSGRGSKEDGEGDDDEGQGTDGPTDDELANMLRAGTLSGMSIGRDTLDDASLDELENALEPYLARLETMLTDPLGDDFCQEFFHGDNSKFVSRKVKKIIERVSLNFVEKPWSKGSEYILKDVVDHKGQRYVLMGEPGKILTLEDYSADNKYKSVQEPDKDVRWRVEPHGKVIVFCRYVRSVKAIYNALPPSLKSIAAQFHGGIKDRWQRLEDFRTTPFSTETGTQILIAVEQSISEGHNLQMASRIVRVESPWSPGELDQSSSRIFRPDTTGQFRRENVYLDWVLCQGTLEVAKVGRLISRMLDKTKFDEANNSLYDGLRDLDLPPISMSLDTIASTPMLEDIAEYTAAYGMMIHIQAAEFEHMRQTKPAEMMPIAPTPMPEGSAILDVVPYVEGLKSVPDRHGVGLSKLTSFLQDEDEEVARELRANPKLLVGEYAHTDLGYGVITRVATQKSGDSKGPNITRVTIQLANGEEVNTKPALVYLALDVSDATRHLFDDGKQKGRKKTAKELRNEEREEARAQKAIEREEARAAKAAKREKEAAKREKAKAKLKKEALIAGKAGKAPKIPKEAPVKRVARAKPVEVEEDPLTLDLYPVVYNEFLAVEAAPGEDDEKDMRKLGFKNLGSYAYTQIKDKPSFDALLEWLDSKFDMPSATSKRLKSLSEAFLTGKGRKFDIEQAPMAEFKNFYNLAHKLAGKGKRGKTELKIYPVIINGALFVNVDLSSNPQFRKHLGKAIPGTRAMKFEEADSLYIQFFTRVSDVERWLKSLAAQKATVENLDEVKERLSVLKVKLKQQQRLAK